VEGKNLNLTEGSLGWGQFIGHASVRRGAESLLNFKPHLLPLVVLHIHSELDPMQWNYNNKNNSSSKSPDRNSSQSPVHE
jgi:hypothetical protein